MLHGATQKAHVKQYPEDGNWMKMKITIVGQFKKLNNLFNKKNEIIVEKWSQHFVIYRNDSEATTSLLKF